MARDLVRDLRRDNRDHSYHEAPLKQPKYANSTAAPIGQIGQNGQMRCHYIRYDGRQGYGNNKEKMPVSVGICIVFAFISGGAVLFSWWEGWNPFDGAYYCFITLSTIGFGDIVPGQALDEGSQ
ncbi:unnamed protein product, partial [Cylicostephanus goldi]